MNRTEDYNYELAQELIAQTPLKDRSSSRLLVVDKKNNKIKDDVFTSIVDYLNPKDVLVINNSKVIPARIYGKKRDTGATIEFLLLKETSKDVWQAMAKPVKRLKAGTVVEFSEDFLAQVIEKQGGGLIAIRLEYSGILNEILAKIGTMPLPPYIKKQLKDQSRYQTVYAKYDGSSAAPTAGLHMTGKLMDKLRQKGVEIAEVTLHIGLGTFLPVSEENIQDHVMHSEYYEISEDTANKINNAKQRASKVYALGTTSVRALEACAAKYGKVISECASTDIFIYPGYEFKVVDGLITNFHLPKSTLLMLVSAFYDRQKILKAYAHAVKEKYRFFSFGDAMIIAGDILKE